MKKLFHSLFGAQLPVQLILFNIISVVGMIGGIISLCVSLATGLPAIQNIVVVASLLTLFFCILLANKKGKLETASSLVIGFITLVLLPAMFFTGGGVYSGMPSWFVIGLVFTFLLIHGKLCWILLGCQVLVFISCFVISFYYPALIRSFPSRAGEYVDIAQSMLIAAFTIGFIIRFLIRTYEQTLVKLKEQNSQLKEARDAATRANSAKTQFLSHMSHDIRTPINGIIGMLDIADSAPEDMARQTDCRNKIRLASDHLHSLINDVLDISMLESGKVEFSEEVFDVRALLEDCTSIIRNTAAERNITVTASCSDIAHPYLFGSPLHIRQILINIAGNSIKYNKDNGSVSVHLKEQKRTAVTAGKKDTTGMTVMEFLIEDTGIGMSEEFLTRIYEPFTQAENGARTKYTGTGLGMAITKNLVDQMGGKISVKSVLGAGTTFTVSLPFRIAAGQMPVKEDVSEFVSIKGMKVLLTEDNDLNREIAQFMLEQAGAHVTNAANGQAAVEAFSASAPGQYDCILMDIMMPVMDGLEATRRIRRLERPDAATVPIIAMTANAFTEDVKKAKDSGMNEYVPKPLNMQHLFKAMASCRRKPAKTY